MNTQRVEAPAYRRVRKVTDEEVRAAREAYGQGKQIFLIAEELRVSVNTARNVIYGLGAYRDVE